MNKIIKTLLFCCLLLNGFAQNNTIDSLLIITKNAKEDSTKVNQFKQLSDEYFYAGNYIKEKEFAQKALDLSKKINWPNGMAKSYFVLGISYADLGIQDSAILNYTKALEIYTKINDHLGMIKSENAIGDIFNYQCKYPIAIKHYLSALKLSEKIGNKQNIANAFNNIGMVNKSINEYDLALKNYFKALEIGNEINDKRTLSMVYNNIGIIYMIRKNNIEALSFILKALEINKENNNKAWMANNYLNLGGIYFGLAKKQEALQNYLLALPLMRSLGDSIGVAASLINIGEVYMSKKQFDIAQKWMFKGLELAKTEGYKEYIMNGYHGLSTIDSTLGNYKGAYENYMLCIKYRDSIVSEENTKKTLQTTMQYEYEKKEFAAKAIQEKKDAIAQAEIGKSKQQKIILVLGLLFAIFFGAWDYKQKQRIAKQKKLSDELLLNILPAEVAEELKKTGEAEAKLMDEVTVLFTDFKGFTAVSEKLTPKELIKDLHECFTKFDNIMQKHGLEKIKTIGDAYMAAGGLPTPNKTHAFDVVSAALEIKQFMEEGKAKKMTANLPFFEIRIGVHTGPVVAGIVGVKKFSYDIWGDTVNTASRMESSGEVGKVNISETTYELVKDKFTCEYRGEIEAKGKGKVKMYFAN